MDFRSIGLVAFIVFPATCGETRPRCGWSRPEGCREVSCFLSQFRHSRGSDGNGSNQVCHRRQGGRAGTFGVGGIEPELLLDVF